jgi:hypothetical protein
MRTDNQDTIAIRQVSFGLLELEVRIALCIVIINMYSRNSLLNGLEEQGMILTFPAR